MNNPKIQVLQFGTGNFLRGFIEPMIQELNQQGNSLNVCLVQSTDSTTLEGLRLQNFAYSVYVTGVEKGKKIEKIQTISCISDGLRLPNDFDQFLLLALEPELRWLISNVTEVGLEWKKEDVTKKIPSTFVGRLTQWLYARFEHAPELETVILPCELIPDNGMQLKNLILRKSAEFNFPKVFQFWLDEKCTFLNTLVDRIVPGFPKQLQETVPPYTVQVEPYLFWGIEGRSQDLDKLPFSKCKGVVLTESLLPYTKRKISILNGLHTVMAALGQLQQIQTVQEYVQDPNRLQELNRLAEEELFPFLDQPLEALRTYTSTIYERFKNPYMAHTLVDISFQSISKFISRLKPICTYFLEEKGALPPRISMGLVALLLGHLRYPDHIRDSEAIKRYFLAQKDRDASELEKVIQACQELFGIEDQISLENAYSLLNKNS